MNIIDSILSPPILVKLCSTFQAFRVRLDQLFFVQWFVQRDIFTVPKNMNLFFNDSIIVKVLKVLVPAPLTETLYAIARGWDNSTRDLFITFVTVVTHVDCILLPFFLFSNNQINAYRMGNVSHMNR